MDSHLPGTVLTLPGSGLFIRTIFIRTAMSILDSNYSREVVLYARVSKDDQATADHFSIEAQLEEMREYAAEHGWTVVEAFVDDMTGQKMRRPGLDALKEMAQTRGFDILLVHELSRLSRASVYETLEIFQWLGEHNIGFASVKEPDFDFADPSKRFFLILLSALNQYYIDLLRVHTQKGKRERARQGLYNASITPFGYIHTGGPQDPPVIDKQEAEVVRKIFDTYAAGKLSHQEIAEHLNTMGFRTRPTPKQPTGGPFAKAHIAKILKNRFYTGKIIYGTRGQNKAMEVFEGQHEALISQELWDRCHRIREARRASSRAAQQPYRVYLLGNMAVCDVCGRKLRSQSENEVSYYRELSYQSGHTDCPNRKTGTRTGPVDAMIHALIDAIRLPQDWLEEVVKRMGDQEELRGLSHHHERLEAERRRLKLMKIRGEFDDDPDLYNREMTRIRVEMDALPTFDELENLRATVAAIQDLPETWAKASPTDQRDLLRLMFRSVQVDVPNGRVVAVIPQAVFIPILREVPLLEEREFGVFVPIWSPEKVKAEPQPPQAVGLPALPRVEPNALASGLLPFLDRNPLQPQPDTRLATGLKRALEAVKAQGQEPEMVIQPTTNGHGMLPVDLSKWPFTAEMKLPTPEILARPEESIDVLATQFWVWERLAEGKFAEAEALLDKAFRVLTSGGTWYAQEVLPLEMPAHWVFRFFPSVWGWAKEFTWDFYALHARLQGAGFTPQATRHVYFQPLTVSSALAVARQRPTLLAKISDRDYQHGLHQLEQLLSTNDSDLLLSSEVAIIEFWGQKITHDTLNQPRWGQDE